MKKIGKIVIKAGAFILVGAFIWIWISTSLSPSSKKEAGSGETASNNSGGGGFHLFEYHEAPKQTPPTPQVKTVKVTKDGFSEKVDVSDFNFENHYPDPVLILADEGKTTEKMLRRDHDGIWLQVHDPETKEKSWKKIEKLPMIATERFKSIVENSIEVRVDLIPK